MFIHCTTLSGRNDYHTLLACRLTDSEITTAYSGRQALIYQTTLRHKAEINGAQKSTAALT